MRNISTSALKVVLWDDPTLSKVCDKIEDNEFGQKLEAFGEQLLATMTAHDGLGLAAPQVGVAKRMFVMDLPEHKDLGHIVVCNPVLDLRGTLTYAQEGCLSLPGVYEQVSRAEEVWMQYRTPSGEHREALLTHPLEARVAQHETDHTNGIMFFDFKDKRENFFDSHGRPYGSRMSKQLSKQVLRNWDKERIKRGV
jgi:peptide deformylase